MDLIDLPRSILSYLLRPTIELWRRFGRARIRSAPYSRGWRSLSRCSGAHRVLGGDDEASERSLLEQEHSGGTALTDDALAAVFARLAADGAAVVRCAATCRRWGRIVGKEAATLSRALPRLGGLALGFFHQENLSARRRDTSDDTAVPCFVPTASASRLFPQYHGISDLDCSRPVACRNGRLVLELPRDGHAGSLRLCVCDPMTASDADALLPPLSGEDRPGYYVYALITGDDVDPPVLSPAYFRLLLVYNRRGFTALRRYSSDTGIWGPETKADVRISSGWLRHMGTAAVLHGVVHWLLHGCMLGVRLDGPSEETLDQYVLPDAAPRHQQLSQYRAIGVSPEGRLCMVFLCLSGSRRILRLLRASFRTIDGGDGDIRAGGRWERGDRSESIRLDQFELRRADDMTCRWFCERSGVVLFTLDEGSSIRGTFALSLETKGGGEDLRPPLLVQHLWV